MGTQKWVGTTWIWGLCVSLGKRTSPHDVSLEEFRTIQAWGIFLALSYALCMAKSGAISWVETAFEVVSMTMSFLMFSSKRKRRNAVLMKENSHNSGLMWFWTGRIHRIHVLAIDEVVKEQSRRRHKVGKVSLVEAPESGIVVEIERSRGHPWPYSMFVSIPSEFCHLAIRTEWLRHCISSWCNEEKNISSWSKAFENLLARKKGKEKEKRHNTAADVILFINE